RREKDGDGIPRPLDLDLGDAGIAVLTLDELANLEVLDQEVAEFVLRCVPAAPPVLHDPHAEPGRSNLLAHVSASFPAITTLLVPSLFRLRPGAYPGRSIRSGYGRCVGGSCRPCPAPEASAA